MLTHEPLQALASGPDGLEDIKKLLTERPENVVGLAVPAMPMGSPGMEHPDFPHKRVEYDVLLVNKIGSYSSYTHYDAVN